MRAVPDSGQCDSFSARTDDLARRLTSSGSSRLKAGIEIPIVKNKVFLFGNYEGLRRPAGIITYGRVPTDLEKQGDFPRSAFPICDFAMQRRDPANASRLIREPFAGNLIPRNRIDPMMQDLVSKYPAPNFIDPNPAVFNNRIVIQQNRDRIDSMNLKNEWVLTSRDTHASDEHDRLIVLTMLPGGARRL